MLYVCVQKFDMMNTVEIFLETKHPLLLGHVQCLLAGSLSWQNSTSEKTEKREEKGRGGYNVFCDATREYKSFQHNCNSLATLNIWTKEERRALISTCQILKMIRQGTEQERGNAARADCASRSLDMVVGLFRGTV